VFTGFEASTVDVGETRLFIRRAGTGPPLLLLHGFPETHLMWRRVAPLLATDFTVVCADLRGYGSSSAPASTPDHSPYAKSAMAGDMVRMMKTQGFPSFGLAGHDRGARVAYRLALDSPECVERLALLDIIPTDEAFARADARLAMAFWPWWLLAQPEPLPERLIGAAPDALVDHALAAWGSRAESCADVRDAYVAALRNPASVHAICEEYRAASTLDRARDAADRDAGRRITAPTLVLWSAGGALDTLNGEEGSLGIWRRWASHVRGRSLAGGHFFPEENPVETAAELRAFFLERAHPHVTRS
jgi:haloacetate dehalogenase